MDYWEGEDVGDEELGAASPIDHEPASAYRRAAVRRRWGTRIRTAA